MTNDTKSSHITPIGGNVFADLGFDPAEAQALKAHSDLLINQKNELKCKMMKEISSWIASEKLMQEDAAKILGVTRPRVSDVINKKTIKFSIDSLLDMLNRIGKNVSLSIG